MSNEKPEEPKKPASLVRKLANVMGASERVPKNGRNKFHNYDYATESDITAAVRAEMATQGIVIIPTIESVDWEVVETKGGARERFCTLHMLYTILDADSADKLEIRLIGQGQDGGDKALYKALTGATKYMVLKLFLLPTGDDPEADSPQGEVRAPQQSGNELAAIEQAKAEREAARLKLLASFAAIGVDAAAVAKRLGHAATTIGNDEWTQLRKWYDEMRKAEEQRKTDPDEAAREVVRKQAEASLAEADRNAKTFPQVVDDLRAASTSVAVMLVGANFAHYEKKWPTGDMKAIRRTYADRLSVVQDAEREAKKSTPPQEDVKL